MPQYNRPALWVFSGGLNCFMAAVTRIALQALDQMGGPRIVLAGIPGGARAVAREAGVSAGRVSQVLRMDKLPWEWAELLARLAGCCEWEVYEQLGQRVSAPDTAGPNAPVSARRSRS
jgi:hypothetical protein